MPWSFTRTFTFLGALVLLAVDVPVITSSMGPWWFLVYPSLAFTLAVMLPLGAATNWLKRNVRSAIDVC